MLDGGPVGTGDPVVPSPRQQPLPTSRPMSIVAKRSPISATAELLFVHVAYGRDSVLIRQGDEIPRGRVLRLARNFVQHIRQRHYIVEEVTFTFVYEPRHC